MARRIACAAVLCIPSLAWADAKPLALALDYIAVPDCPDAGDFEAIVNERLGYDAIGPGAQGRVLVQIASRNSAFEGRIEWRSAEGAWAGDRTFASRNNDCRDLARAMAFALALQIQLSANAGAPPAASDDTPAKTNPTAEAPAPPAVPPALTPLSGKEQVAPASSQSAEPPPRGARPVLAVGAGASLGFGVSSGVVPFGRAFGSIAWPHWSLELAAEVGVPTMERRADGAGFAQQELLAGVAGCGILAPWSVCLLGKSGVIRIVGKDIDEPVTRTGPLVEVGLRLAVVQPLGRRVYVAARAEGLLIVTRWRVTLDQTHVWTSSRFAENIGLDVGIRFP